jgi:hypothetical protein
MNHVSYSKLLLRMASSLLDTWKDKAASLSKLTFFSYDKTRKIEDNTRTTPQEIKATSKVNDLMNHQIPDRDPPAYEPRHTNSFHCQTTCYAKHHFDKDRMTIPLCDWPQANCQSWLIVIFFEHSSELSRDDRKG